MAGNEGGSGLMAAYQALRAIGGKTSKPEPKKQKPKKKRPPSALNTLQASRARVERASRISRGLEDF